ncbi:MAG: repeat protein [Myxococcales bacterium]|nr:repeat protein [Myxococcales bacterium]
MVPEVSDPEPATTPTIARSLAAVRSNSLVIVTVVIAAMFGCKSRPAPERQDPAAAPGAASTAASNEPLPREIEADVAKLAAAEQATAKQAKGTVSIARAWRSETGPRVAAGHAWVLVEVDFGALRIDTDDLELHDPDRNVTAPIGDVRRLDAAGNPVVFSGAHSNEAHYLLAFEIEAATRRVSLRYWGETLTSAPAEIAASGPVFAEPRRDVIGHFAKGERHILLFEDHNQEGAPGDTTTHVGFDGGECLMRGILPVSAKLGVVDPSVESIISHAFYAADYTCAKPPTKFEWGAVKPIPAAAGFAVPAATLDALEGRGADLVSIPTGEESPAVAVRTNGSMIAIALAQNDIQLVDASGKELGRIAYKGPELTRLGFTPDGAKVWGVEDSGDVTVWDVASTKVIASRRLTPEPDMYGRAKLSSDGRWLAVDHPWIAPDGTSVAWSGQITVLSMPDLAVKGSVKIVDGDTGSISDLALSADGRRLVVCATTSTESMVRVYGLPAGAQQVALRSTTSRAQTCALAPDGRILVGTEEGELEIYDRGGKRSSVTAAHAGGVGVLAVRPNGTFLSGGNDGRILDWGRSGKPVVLFQHKYPVGDIQVAGDYVVSTSSDDTAVLVTGKLVKRLSGAPSGPHDMAAASGMVVVAELAIQAKANRVRIWRRP